MIFMARIANPRQHKISANSLTLTYIIQLKRNELYRKISSAKGFNETE
jgi:hypothetical protein